MSALSIVEKEVADRDLEALAFENIDKLKCTLVHGLKIGWYYTEDAEFFKETETDVRLNVTYAGTVLAMPDKEFRDDLEHDECFVAVHRYPCEKEGPRVDYVAMNRLLSIEGLVEIFALEESD